MINVTNLVFPYQWQRDRNEYELTASHNFPPTVRYEYDFDHVMCGTPDEGKIKPDILDGRLPVVVTPRGQDKDWRFRIHFHFTHSPGYQELRSQLGQRPTEPVQPRPVVDVLVTGAARSGKKFLVREYAYARSARVLDMTCMDNSLLVALGPALLAQYVLGFERVDMVILDLNRHGDLIRVIANTRADRLPKTLVVAVATVSDPTNQPRITRGCHVQMQTTLPWRAAAMLYHTNNKVTMGECRSLARLWTNYEYYSNTDFYLWKHSLQGIRDVVTKSVPESAVAEWVATRPPMEDEDKHYAKHYHKDETAEDLPWDPFGPLPPVQDVEAKDAEHDSDDDEGMDQCPFAPPQQTAPKAPVVTPTSRVPSSSLASSGVATDLAALRSEFEFEKKQVTQAYMLLNEHERLIDLQQRYLAGHEKTIERQAAQLKSQSARIQELEAALVTIQGRVGHGDTVKIDAVGSVTNGEEGEAGAAHTGTSAGSGLNAHGPVAVQTGEPQPRPDAPVCSHPSCRNRALYWESKGKYYKQCRSCKARHKASRAARTRAMSVGVPVPIH